MSLPTVVLLDSGVGGLSVYAAIRARALPCTLAYCADTAHFPYGTKSDEELVAIVTRVADALVARFAPVVFVVACNTASTLVLAMLRARFPEVAFVGTVPAIKPAAAVSKSRVIGLLATEATVRGAYVDSLASEFASDCTLLRAGSRGLVRLAERKMAGDTVGTEEVAHEIAPLFAEAMRVERETGARMDAVVLGCTHFPLLADEMRSAAPWQTHWIDSGPAIARRVEALLAGLSSPEILSAHTLSVQHPIAVFTGSVPSAPAYLAALSAYGFLRHETLPLA